MSSNRGIFRISKRQLEDVAAGRQSRVIAVSYGRSDGMLNVECNGGLWPAGARDKEGRLWFPTQEGVAVVDTASALITGQSPRVVLEHMELDHAPVDTQKPLVIQPGQGDLEIQYTALGVARPDQAVFRAWIIVGKMSAIAARPISRICQLGNIYSKRSPLLLMAYRAKFKAAFRLPYCHLFTSQTGSSLRCPDS
jgi:hypothetical protein